LISIGNYNKNKNIAKDNASDLIQYKWEQMGSIKKWFRSTDNTTDSKTKKSWYEEPNVVHNEVKVQEVSWNKEKPKNQHD